MLLSDVGILRCSKRHGNFNNENTGVQTSPMLAKARPLQHSAYNITGRITCPIASSCMVHGMYISGAKHLHRLQPHATVSILWVQLPVSVCFVSAE